MFSVQCTDEHIGVRKGELLVSNLTEELLQFRQFFLLILSTMDHDTAIGAILSNTSGGFIRCKMKMTIIHRFWISSYSITNYEFFFLCLLILLIGCMFEIAYEIQ